MTHKSFHQIMDWIDELHEKDKLEYVNRFLDGDMEDVIFQELFDIWKLGDFIPMWDLIKIINQDYYDSRANDRSIIIPDDFDLPRQPSNRNMRNA